MKKSQLTKLIRETVTEVFNELKEDVSFSAGSAEECNESSPPNFPPALEKKLLAQYKDAPQKAYATMWRIHKAKNEGHQKVCEMWMAWENKGLKEVGEQVAYEVWVNNNEYPISAEEVEEIVNKHRGVKMKWLGDATIQGFTDTAPTYRFNISGPSGDVDALANELSEVGNGIEFTDSRLEEEDEGSTEETPETPEGEAAPEEVEVDQDAAHDEADMENPEENKEVDLAKQIKSLADELLAMHGVEDTEDEEGEAEKGEEAGEETAPEEPAPESDETKEVPPLEEKWGVKDAVHPSRKGMFKGKSKEDLLKQKSNLKKKGPHKRGSKEDTKMKQLNFAIRAKGKGGKKWGKAK